jgi:hypothetical protein
MNISRKSRRIKYIIRQAVILVPPSVIKGLFSTSITWLNIFLISSNRFNNPNIAVNIQIKYTEINIQYKMFIAVRLRFRVLLSE